MAKPATKKASTVRVGKTKIKGATAADRQAIEAGKAAARAEAKTVTTADTPEAQTTTRAKKAATKAMFDKADRAAAATPEEGTLSRAVRGW